MKFLIVKLPVLHYFNKLSNLFFQIILYLVLLNIMYLDRPINGIYIIPDINFYRRTIILLLAYSSTICL